jgi:cell division inhibitor SepF
LRKALRWSASGRRSSAPGRKEAAMAGVWRKTMRYLGLVEEDEFDDAGEPVEEMDNGEPATVGSGRAASADDRGSVRRLRRGNARSSVDEPTVRTIQARSATGTIHRAEPRRFNEARELGERFKDGVPVIMNLQQTEDAIARRLVDFASGLVFAHDGKIELVANRVYLLTPNDVEVSAEERERLREGGFYNQF